ncbi:MAG TPA: acyl-CoA dehydrogenase [Chitinophagales bacterium]|nr:acyl-CoA dehydrogenase [Chitinophagales bacterium]
MEYSFYSKRNLKFILNQVHHIDQLAEYPLYEHHDTSTFDMFLDATEDVAKEYFFPIFTEMDRDEPQLVDGRIRVHPNMRNIMKVMGEGGWISCAAPMEYGGDRLPVSIMYAASFIMGCANYSVTAFPFLSMGAAGLILSYGTEEQKKKYTPSIFDGKWQGTMALTEPEAGSSLTDVVSSAKPLGDGKYLMKGQKIFISCGDHDAVDNVIHLMLARIEGAPAGIKGISLFIVPREKIQDDGSLIGNDVLTAGLYHKMGYKGAPIAHLSFGENENCVGELIGEENKGLSYMFQMMNEARISVGLHATSIATAAYYASLQYAKERSQGRPLTGKDPKMPQVPIIQHADVRRLLLAQKSFIEGALSLEMQCSLYEDMSRVTEGAEKKKYQLLLDTLTPIAKSYPSETACLSTSWALQCLGGYGFTTDFPLEQYYREVRIHPIHEGTTAIHGMDLLGRKIMAKNGQAVMLLAQEILKEIETAKQSEETKPFAEQLEKNLGIIQKTTMHLMGVAQKEGPTQFLSDATLYLEMMGIIAMSWQWMKISNVANNEIAQNGADDFLHSKITCMKYYFEYELIKVSYLSKRLTSDVKITTTLNENELD